MGRTRVILTITAMAALLAGATISSADNVPLELDLDRDGYISAQEAERVPELLEQFGVLDIDKDGKISHSELILFVQQ
ncbi:EF-hand domain-containing protein [Desulfogranum mediterraneum]|uniref:hypothetical protein n=1 Tax=Desulfogranum mediterraneum TaxID=160661 RepID=UPI00041D9E1E|nr:hypothetical protein [Desulfogranum mediterraneum]